jgi:hypothetical protein
MREHYRMRCDGLGKITGCGYGLPRVRVLVGIFPPAKNPYPRGGLCGLPLVSFFFFILCFPQSLDSAAAAADFRRPSHRRSPSPCGLRL